MELGELTHGGWYQLDDDYPDFDTRGGIVFQVDFVYGANPTILITARDGERAFRMVGVPLERLLPWLRPAEKPANRVQTVDPDETIADMAARALRERLHLDARLAAEGLKVVTEEEPDAPDDND